MATADPDDPRLWDEDRVVLEVCKKPISAFTRVPNRDRLEQPLRENNINGEFLLELDVDTLKVDLGISSLGQRKAILKGIDLLRPGPAPFTMEERVRMYREGLETPEITHPRLSLPASVNVPRLSIEQDVAQTPSIAPNRQIRSSSFGPVLYEGQFGMAAPSQPIHLLRQGITTMHAPSVPEYQEESAMLVDQGQAGFTSAAQTMLLQDDRRSDPPWQPHLQTDVEGRIIDLPIAERGIVPNSMRQPSVSSQPKVEQNSLLKLKKRIAPTFIAHLQKPKPVSKLDILERFNNDSYLGVEALTIQDTFYGSDIETDDEAFEMVSSKKAAGYRRAVACRMFHYLRSSPVLIPNTKMIARLPYTSQQCVGPSSQHLFTLLAPNASPIVQRVDNWPSLSSHQRSPIHPQRPILHFQKTDNNTSDIDIGPNDDAFALPADSPNDPANLGDFAYLLEKYPAQPVEDEGLPLYGESDDENGYDDETWDEIEAEKAEIVRSKTIMSTVEVTSTVDAAIVNFEQDWKLNKLPKVEAKAYQLWMKVANLRMRQPERDVINGTLRRCEARLVKLKHAIISDDWNKPSDVKAQCHSMEETINTILECHHMLKILERDTPPPKPDRQALKKHKPRVELPEGEELLDSDDDIDAFVVDDSSSVEDIPFVVEHDFNPILPAQSEPQRQDQLQQDLPIAESTTEVRIESDLDPPENTGDEADIESDSEDKILSPSQKRRRSGLSKTPRKLNKSTDEATEEVLDPISSNNSQNNPDLDAIPKLPRTKYRLQGQSETQAIDLTFSDPLEPMNDTNSSEFEIKTPPLNPAATPHPKLERSECVNRGYSEKMTPKAQAKKSQHFHGEGQLPTTDNVIGIRKLDWLGIENDSDRIRALCKGVYDLEESEFNAFHAYINTSSFIAHDQRLKDDLTWLRYSEDTERKVGAKHQASVKLLCLLFMTFVCYKDIVSTRKPSQSDFNTSYDSAERASRSFFQQLKQACDIYHDFLRATPKTGRRGTKRKSPSPDLEDFIVSDMDSDVLAPGEAPEHSQTYKKRKRAVKESREVKVQQKTDQQRVREQELRRQAMETKFKSLHKDDGKGDHYVNFDEPFILLDPHIARRAMPHQIDGIRFLWREIIEDPKHQGCLLAHTMGLGKTMQVISLLATIAQCNQSERSAVRARIPVHLQRSQTLILCPPSLLDNWYDELLMWLPTPDLLGKIHKIASSKDGRISRWASDGGVLLISYNLFRGMLVPTERKQMSDPVLTEHENWLLKKASMVIADEAHQMKNVDSKLTGAARRIQTKSRIAMTGSPLNNNLDEYHTMVDWIAPGYLGTALNFKTKYVEPITLGLYKDSTPYEHRVSKKKLHVLKQDLAPKVNRADISAISKELPSKTEYLITLPLTDLQRQAYDIYVGQMIQQYGTSGHTIKKGLFSLIAILSSLCNHPSIFVKKFKTKRDLKPPEETGEETDAAAIDISDAGTSPGGESPAEIDTPQATRSDLVAMEKAVKVFEDTQAMGGMNDIRLSHRAEIVQQILHRSIAKGDKTLLFSHSLDVLDYLETLLKQIQCEYMRIDGSTNVDKRQNITKQFNRHDSLVSVCLVSTKAGGLGLNFQGASRIIIFDFGFNPMWEEQAVGRAYRLGQQQPVHVYRFRTGGTIDEIIHNKAVFKTQLFSRVVDKKSPIRYASNNVADYLFLSRDVEQQEFDECKGTDPGVLDDIIAESAQIRKIELDETFHKEDGEELNEEELKEANEEYDRQRLQRDDPVAYLKKYGTNIPGQGLFGNQSPTFLAGSVSQAAPNMRGSDSVKKPRARPPGKLVEHPSSVIAHIATPVSFTDQQLGAYMPTASMATQSFDQNLIFKRQTTPSALSGAIGQSAKDVSTPDSNPGNAKVSALNTPGCESQ